MSTQNTRVKLLKRVVTKQLEEIHKNGKLIDQNDYQQMLKLYQHEFIQDIPNGREWAFLMGCKASILAHLAIHIIDHPKLVDMYKCLDLIKQRYLIEKHHKIRNCQITKNCAICSTCSVEVLYKRLWNIVCGGALKQRNINEGRPDEHVCVEKDLPAPDHTPLIVIVKNKILSIYDETNQFPENATDMPTSVNWPILRETLDCYVMTSEIDDTSNQYLDEID